MKRRFLSALLPAGLMLASTNVGADAPATYPARPIRLIVPTTPGGPPDVVARLIGEKVAAALGQPVIIDNRAGAGGTIGMSVVAKAGRDGYTLAVSGIPAVALSPHLLSHVPYDAEKDFTPVTLIAWNYNILAVPAASPVKSVPQLLETARAKPGALRFSSGGNGTPAHLASELLKRETRVDIQHVPYTGSAAGVRALMTGDADMMIGAVGTLAPHIKSGRLRALATSAPQRIAAYPELPTLVELGYPSVQIRDWQTLFAPNGTPRPVIDRLHAEIAKAIRTAEVLSRLESLGMEAAGAGPADAREHIRGDLRRWAGLIREIGLKAD